MASGGVIIGSVTVVPPPPVPRYGERTLAEVLPSLLAAIDVNGFANPLGIAPARGAGLLLVDRLGWELLHAYAAGAPSLAADGAPMFAGFPATTAVRLATLGTRRPPGDHGIVGYTFARPGAGLLSTLTWRSPQGAEPAADRLRDQAGQWVPIRGYPSMGTP